MSDAPSTHTRIPSSARAVNKCDPAAKLNCPVQRTEKLSAPSPVTPGPAAPQSYVMLVSHRLNAGDPARLLLL